MIVRVPARDPDILRRFQLTDFEKNSNKFWTIRVWESDGSCVYETEYARTGYKPQKTVKQGRRSRAESLIQSKLRKGYQEIRLASVASAGATTGDVEIDGLIAKLFREANEYIDSYLAGAVDQLSLGQINQGRSILAMLSGVTAVDDGVVSLAQNYYNTIPTQLPRKINASQVAKGLISDLHEQEDRLDQLESAIKSESIGRGVKSPVEIIGAEIVDVSADPECEPIVREIERKSFSRRIHGIYRVRIPEERESFVGDGDLLYHGTRSANVRHILNGGLIIPRHAANGSMFGRGIYFAGEAAKSLGYCRGNITTLLVAEVALGKVYQSHKAMHSLKRPPDGYDSVHGVKRETKSWGGFLKYDEFIVYDTNRQTLRYLVIMD